jgi:hypothetical protein
MAGPVKIGEAGHGQAIPELSNPAWGKLHENELREIHHHFFDGGN